MLSLQQLLVFFVVTVFDDVGKILCIWGIPFETWVSKGTDKVPRLRCVFLHFYIFVGFEIVFYTLPL